MNQSALPLTPSTSEKRPTARQLSRMNYPRCFQSRVSSQYIHNLIFGREHVGDFKRKRPSNTTLSHGSGLSIAMHCLICASRADLLEHNNILREGQRCLLVLHCVPSILDDDRPIRVRLNEGKRIRQHPRGHGVMLQILPHAHASGSFIGCLFQLLTVAYCNEATPPTK